MIELLHKQAAEIAAAGHKGWGNTMTDAASEIERLVVALERVHAAINSGAGRCGRQCQEVRSIAAAALKPNE